MSEISQLNDQITEALSRLRSAIVSSKAAGQAAATPSDEVADLRARVAELEAANADLTEELERLREKRDKDVAALDELIAQLKPLIEEV